MQRDIPGYEGRYAVDTCGRVWSHLRRKYLKACTDGRGYLFVRLQDADGNVRQPKVHRLVMETFKPTSDLSLNVNHIDGQKRHNAIENLEWVTQSENIRHAFRLGLSSQVGERNAASKLTDAEVIELRRLHQSGVKPKIIAEMYKISRAHVSNLVNYKRRSANALPRNNQILHS